MSPGTRRALSAVPLTLATCAALGAAASCGSRTGLLGPAEEAPPASDAGTDSLDAPDAVDTMPGIDAMMPDVPVINPCPNAAATLIYAIAISNRLYSFDPMAGTFTPIGTIGCPDPGSPFSMAVDREGVAFVVFRTGSLFRVSTKNAACRSTSYDPFANGNVTFGMGFVANVSDASDAGETLFVSRDVHGIGSDSELATIDTSTFKLHNVAYFHPKVAGSELTGTGDGRLFAFSPSPGPGGSFIAQIDPTTARVIAKDNVPGVQQGMGWAFGFWGGAFYTFTTPNSGDPVTVVHKFDPVSKTSTEVAKGPGPDTIVGAGVSTCAPQR